MISSRVCVQVEVSIRVLVPRIPMVHWSVCALVVSTDTYTFTVVSTAMYLLILTFRLP